MSRICRNVGDSGKLRFYELDHESKMRLLKTHSHTSNSLAMEPGTCEEKQLKKTQTLQQGKRHPSKPAACRRCGGGRAQKALEPAAYRRCGGGGRKGSTANQSQKRYYGEASPRRYGENTGANTREKSCEKPPAGHWAWRGVRRENDKYPGWKVATPTAPLGVEVFSRKKQSRTNTTHQR